MRSHLGRTAVLEIYEEVRRQDARADAAMQRVLRREKALRSVERRAVADAVYGLLRLQGRVDHLLGRALSTRKQKLENLATPTQHLLRYAAWLILGEGQSAQSAANLAGPEFAAYSWVLDLVASADSLAAPADRLAGLGPAGRPRRPPRRPRRGDEPPALAREALVRTARRRGDSLARAGAQPARSTHHPRERVEDDPRLARGGACRGRRPGRSDALRRTRAHLHEPHERVRARRLQAGPLRGAGRRKPAHRGRVQRTPRADRGRRLRRRGRKVARAGRGDAEQGAARRLRPRWAATRRIPAPRTARRSAQLGGANRAGWRNGGAADRRSTRARGLRPRRRAVQRARFLAPQPRRSLASHRRRGANVSAAAKRDSRALLGSGPAGGIARLRDLLDQSRGE